MHQVLFRYKLMLGCINVTALSCRDTLCPMFRTNSFKVIYMYILVYIYIYFLYSKKQKMYTKRGSARMKKDVARLATGRFWHHFIQLELQWMPS